MKLMNYMFKRKYFRTLIDAYRKLKKDKEIKLKFGFKGKFIDRSNGRTTLCIVLAGYKEFLYENIFERINNNSIEEMDICVCTSGLYSETIDDICKKYGWSYLSTKRNNVALIQNIAIKKHPNAKMIFKLDEDIFITENYFIKMQEAYVHAKQGEYKPGVLAPIIPINGYGYMRILEKLKLKNYYEKKFEKPIYMAGPNQKIESSPEVAEFFWGEGGIIPTIDELNRIWGKEKKEERPCPIRFSIGAILYEREFWEDMNFFQVNKYGSQMGMDEKQLCAHCINSSQPLMVSENIVVGHLSFGKQNETMKEYYYNHLERF